MLPMIGYWGVVAMIVGAGSSFVGLVWLVRTPRGDPVKRNGPPQSRSRRLVGDVVFILIAAMFFTLGYKLYHWQFG